MSGLRSLATLFAITPLVAAPAWGAGAVYDFSGQVLEGESANAFGFAGPKTLAALPVSGRLRIGGFGLPSTAPTDDTVLEFSRASLTLTLDFGSGGSAVLRTETSSTEGTGNSLAVFNGVNPRFGLSSAPSDDLEIQISSGTGSLALFFLSFTGAIGVDLFGGGAPGALFDIVLDGSNGVGDFIVFATTGDEGGYLLVGELFSLSLTSVPAPGAAALLGSGLLGLAGYGSARSRRRNRTCANTAPAQGR